MNERKSQRKVTELIGIVMKIFFVIVIAHKLKFTSHIVNQGIFFDRDALNLL